MRLHLDMETLQRIETLDPTVRRQVDRHAAEYLSLLDIARRHAHTANPSSAEAQAREPKLAAYKTLEAAGFDPRQSVAVFRHICAELADRQEPT